MNQLGTPKLPGTKITNQRVDMTYGSSHLCSRRWKARCPSVGELQAGKVGVGGRVREHPHRSRGREHGMGVFRVDTRKERKKNNNCSLPT